MLLKSFAAGLCLVSGIALADSLDWSFYHARYGLTDENQKLVDNRGNGFEELYGVRNFREVLRGVLYRGGANNAFHRTNPRNNSNPLPEDGLVNLCEEGYQTSVYLYTTNYHTASPLVACQSLRGANQLTYLQRNFTGDAVEILRMVHAAISDPSKGPIYLHCWNGWHASGSISAYALKQFCGLTGEEALDYWIRNTDGHSSGMENLKARIRNFQPVPELMISPERQNEICPNR